MSAASDILQELLAAMPDSYQKTIGFPTYDLLAAAALRMEGTDAELEAAKAKLDPENLTGDELDRYRRESNQILTRRAAESNNLVQEKYITLSIPQRKIEETRTYFRRVDANLSKGFGRLDSGAKPLTTHDRLRILPHIMI